MNAVVLVGRLCGNPNVITTDNGKQFTTITLAVHRSYKNSDGVYETDFIKCVLWNGIATTACEYCHSGDIVGIKGRIETSKYLDKEEKVRYVTEIIADKVTFLSNGKTKEEAM